MAWRGKRSCGRGSRFSAHGCLPRRKGGSSAFEMHKKRFRKNAPVLSRGMTCRTRRRVRVAFPASGMPHFLPEKTFPGRNCPGPWRRGKHSGGRPGMLPCRARPWKRCHAVKHRNGGKVNARERRDIRGQVRTMPSKTVGKSKEGFSGREEKERRKMQHFAGKRQFFLEKHGGGKKVCLNRPEKLTFNTF